MDRRQPVSLTGDAVMIKSKSTRSSSFGRLLHTAILSQTEMTSTASRTTRSDELNDTMPASIKRKLINVSPLYLSLAVTYGHVFLSPYTKVEESFTLHAVHDILAYGQQPGHLSQVCHCSVPSMLMLTAIVGPCHLSRSSAKILRPSNSAWWPHIPFLGSSSLHGLDQDQAGCTDTR